MTVESALACDQVRAVLADRPFAGPTKVVGVGIGYAEVLEMGLNRLRTDKQVAREVIIVVERRPTVVPLRRRTLTWVLAAAFRRGPTGRVGDDGGASGCDEPVSASS